MSTIKHVRLWPTGNTSIGAAWTGIAGKSVAELWKELAEGKENRYQGNTNGEGSSELLPSETTGITAATLAGPIAAFHVAPYVLAGNERILAAKVVGRWKEVTSNSVEQSAAGASTEGHSFVEKTALVPGTTPAFWFTVSYTAEDVEKMNSFPVLLKQMLETATVDARMVKAKEVRCFTLYLDLEIEVTGTVYTDSATVKATGTVQATEGLTHANQSTVRGQPAATATNAHAINDQATITARPVVISSNTHTLSDLATVAYHPIVQGADSIVHANTTSVSFHATVTSTDALARSTTSTVKAPATITSTDECGVATPLRPISLASRSGPALILTPLSRQAFQLANESAPAFNLHIGD